MIINIDKIINHIHNIVKSHKLDKPGEYTRWIWQDEKESRKLGINEYGCADAANILYTIGEFPKDEETRKGFVNALQNMQNPQTGLFVEATHHPIHTTAHCTAALELFEAKPLYPMTALKEHKTADGIAKFLDSLDWEGDPWDMSHRGAGIYAALKLAEEVDNNWCDAYFNWLWENADEKTGMWRKGAIDSGKMPHVCHMAGTFHYLFNHEYAHMPLRYPDKLIDTCLDMYNKKELTPYFGRYISFAEVDLVYCINRASRQTPHRFDECKAALVDFAVGYIDYLNNLDHSTDDGFNDLHALFGVVCCLAELQQALPGIIKSTKPLKLVLDRRPFI